MKLHLLKKNTTLKQLGFDNKIATGIGENFLNYPIDLSHSKQIDSIHFKIKYNAAAILAKNSFLTLKVNDVPVASTSIYQSENKVSTWNVDVDQDLLKSGLNNFSFIYTLHLPEEKCSPDEMNLAWGTIQKDSELNIKLTNKTANFYLSNIKSFITGNVLVVLPKTFENSIHQIENLLNLIKDLSYLDSITLVSDNEFDSSDKKENIIFIGDHLKKLNSMPVSFEQKKLMVDPQLLPEIMLSDETPESIIELIPSPFRNDKTLLVISSPNQNGLSRAFETLTDPNKINLSQGNILLLYPNKTFISFQSQKIYEAKYALSKKIQNKVYFSWLFIILIVIGLVIYFYKKMNRNDND